ncbi:MULTISPECIES: VHL beta domain-containing protein [Catenuloplanes]|uniref:von Hippel-Lindau disease tumour suppressor beta domain-containing protein n=1 Tax=Catenuloplanes niger TaxID=587534 RepID=A0AAE3ZVZ3_9ACTN|nr:hypothetical protein [Catenuloplanes niger]MDR7327079.1 hypothetical protein [Catenuloplanes niger]
MTLQTHDPHGAGRPDDVGRRALVHAVLAASAVLVTGIVAAAVLFVARDGGERTDARATPSASATPPGTPGTGAPEPAAGGDPDEAAAGWPTLPSLPAGTAPRDPTSTTKTRISFENHTTDVYTVSWLDTDGEVTRYATLHPGQSYVQDTYAGHYWAVGVAGGATTAVFLAGERPGRAVITS